MECKEKLIQAVQKNEMILFLRGEGSYKIEASQYAPSVEHTDVGRVLSKGIYKLYIENPIIKQEFERVLIEMLEGTLFDVYIVLLYVMSQLFKEKNSISPFRLNFDEIIHKLKLQLKIRKKEFQKGLIYPDGLEKKEVWNEIERFNKICKEEYHISLLD